MASRGVWHLRELAIRYSMNGGSSQGVRHFVEDGLVAFARANPQIAITTRLEAGHPNVHAKYVTGYEKNLSMKNMPKDEVAERIHYLRNSLGRNAPRHNHMSHVERDFVSVQGFWRNTGELRRVPLPAEVETRARREAQYGLNKVLDDIGLEGVARTLNKLRDRQREAHAAALAALPQKERVLPTE